MKHELVTERRAFVAELCQHGEEALTDDALFYEVLEAGGYLCTKEIVRNDRRALGIKRKTLWVKETE